MLRGSMTNVAPRFSIFWFTVQIALQFSALLVAFRFLLPGVWSNQFSHGWTGIALVFLGAHLFLCFFEWVFHRYVLHSVVSSPLELFARAHRNHHGLTSIRLQPVAAGSDRYVLNEYPIVEEEQHKDSAFPWWAYLGFLAWFSPLLAVLQWIFPTVPILLGGLIAITWSMSLYEILHAIEHLPYEWWKRATEHPRFGGMWRKVYGFHHMHHANVSCNEAISGFFGLPIADWVMGTYHQPRELLLEGRKATAKDFAVPRPPRLVQWLDGWARRRESELRRAA
jgi:hemolysin III